MTGSAPTASSRGPRSAGSTGYGRRPRPRGLHRNGIAAIIRRRAAAVVVLLGAGGDAARTTADRIVEAARRSTVRCSVIWLGVADAVAAILESEGVPVFRGVEECVRPIAKTTRAASPRRGDTAAPSVDTPAAGAVAEFLAARPEALDEDESKRALELAGVREFPARRVVESQAPPTASGLRYPLAVKLLARDVPHKSAIGGVRLGVRDDGELAVAAAEVRARGQAVVGADGVRGVLLEEMADDGVDVLVGMTTDPVYGRALAVGPGGVLTELVDHVTVVLPPASAQDVDDALGDSRLAQLLEGHDRGALCSFVARLSELAASGLPGVCELDLNPVRVHCRGVTILDCLITRGSRRPES